MARPKQETLTLFPEIVSITRKFSDAQFGKLAATCAEYEQICKAIAYWYGV